MKYKSLNNCIVYKATKFELFASKVLPYYIPFISKRKRVKSKDTGSEQAYKKNK